MIDFIFGYRNKKGEYKNNIVIGAKTREEAITLFEDQHPGCSWYSTEHTVKTNFSEEHE
jgi:hypothetical protein